MINAKHTPGPWFIRNHGAAIYAKIGCDNHRVASISVTRSLVEEEANGRLIAAAPDLLAALQAIILAVDAGLLHGRFDPLISRQYTDAQAAIAKATGAESA